MLGRLFGKKRPTETISFHTDVKPEYRRPAEQSIAAGRYTVFAPEADGRAVLLLNSSPRLIASVRRHATDCGGSDMLVEWVCEASADHRLHLPIDEFALSCAPADPVEDAMRS